MAHSETVQWTYFGSTTDEVYQRGTKKTNFTPSKIRMSSVVDFSPSWSKVRVIDYSDYYDQVLSKSRNVTDIQLTMQSNTEGKYRCDNTVWTMNASLHGKTGAMSACGGHVPLTKEEPIYNATYRYPPYELEPYRKYDILTFNFLFPPALFDGKSFRREVLFELHYTEPIRATARRIYRSWGSGKVIPANASATNDRVVSDNNYYAIHLRGGDGPFSKANWNAIIPDLLNGARDAIRKDFEYRYFDRNDTIARNATSSGATGAASDPPVVTYTVFLATDLRAFWNLGVVGVESVTKKGLLMTWKENWNRIRNDLVAGIDLQLMTAGNYAKDKKKLQEEIGDPYVGIYIDQQLCSCGKLGYGASHLVGRPSSSFQNVIRGMRLQSLQC